MKSDRIFWGVWPALGNVSSGATSAQCREMTGMRPVPVWVRDDAASPPPRVRAQNVRLSCEHAFAEPALAGHLNLSTRAGLWGYCPASGRVTNPNRRRQLRRAVELTDSEDEQGPLVHSGGSGAVRRRHEWPVGPPWTATRRTVRVENQPPKGGLSRDGREDGCSVASAPGTRRRYVPGPRSTA